MVHTVIYAHPFPASMPITDGRAAVCLAVLTREEKLPFSCTRERGHSGHHEAGTNAGKKLAEWSD